MDLPSTDRSGAEPASQMPSVADYWPDQPGTGTSPGPDRPGTGASPGPDQSGAGPPAGPRHAADDDQPAEVEAPARRMRVTPGGAAALALLVVVGVVLAIFIKQANSDPATSAAAPANSPEASAAASPVPTGPAPIAPAPTATATSALPPPPALPPGNAAKNPKLPAVGTFEVAASADSVTVRSEDLGADLYRVTLAKSADPVTAKVGDSGTNHRLTLVKDDETAAPPITITLNAGIRWDLKLTAGNTETAVNLTQSKLASLELAGGAHIFTLSLPPAAGTLPLRITHGMNQLKINTNSVPVRMALRVGAGKVILDGVTHTDTKPGKVLTSAGFAAAANRLDIDSVEGVGTLTVDTG